MFLEGQTISGLRAWQVHFDGVMALAICRDAPPPADYQPADDAGLEPPDFELIALPDGYHLPNYVRSRRAVRDRLRDAMRRADYVSFAIGGWIGDWGVAGADTARRAGIAHAVWFDRVESQVLAASGGGGLMARIKAAIKSTVTARNERRVLRGADLALLHGQTVYNALAGYSRNPRLVEDIHLEEGDRIPPQALHDKLETAGTGPLRIVYAGRAHRMKGGVDWIETLAGLARNGVDFRADWAGEGEMLEAMKARAAELGLADRITFHGFVTDRARILDLLRASHVLLFCLLTDESPRILIEALHAGTPLVGFRDDFAAGLVGEKGAGRLVPRGDIDALTEALGALAADRAHLRDLIECAGGSARHLTRAQVFAHRSDIIKETLNPVKEVS